MKILIKYQSPETKRITLNPIGDWVDLYSDETVSIATFQYKKIALGIAMVLPEGYEAHVAPRSSTFKNFGIIQTNSIGIIDESYKGDDDWWFYPAYALRNTTIHRGDKICQFRIVQKQPKLEFEEVSFFGTENRGGYGSTGRT